MRALVTGATGYVGGRLVPRLLEAGHEVRCLVRTPSKAERHSWSGDVEIVRGDILEPETLGPALSGCDVAFYLVHSMGSDNDFAAMEAEAAETFRTAAEEAGIERIVYLGGIVPDGDLSPHLASRKRVGEILADGDVAVTEFRAAIIIGSGSISFEMLRYLTDVLPVMTTPRWVRTRCQPIGIRDVLEYLLAASEQDSDASEIVEIGGSDVLTYEEMMQIYGEEAGLKRRIILAVPVLSPRLSSLWVGLVTPLPSGVARPLIDSLEHEVVVSNPVPQERFGIQSAGYRTSVRRALARIEDTNVTTRWSDTGYTPAAAMPGDPDWSGGRVLTDERELETAAPPADVYWAAARMGGEVGYYAANWAWAVRGVIDQFVGGPGLRRGRRHPTELRPGEALDFWRVVSVTPGESLQLEAEMRLPGKGWLRITVEPTASGSTLHQAALFAPRGLWGRLYWLAMLPFHAVIFKGMAEAIVREALARSEPAQRPV